MRDNHRWRTDPYRTGYRVRLLLRAQCYGFAGCRRGCCDHKQQSRDGIHRFRYLRQAVFRASHFGGQTSINLAMDLEKALAGTKTKVLGTTPDMMDVAEDRRRFSALMNELGIR